MRNIRLTLQYDGTNYNGWQAQRSGVVTLQGMLEEKLKEITGGDTDVIAAGRTDAGVHALMQAASFRTASALPSGVIKRALNSILPDDVRVIDACEADEGFHPRYDAKSKTYFYLISHAHVLSPFLSRYAWKVPYRLDHGGMEHALSSLKGTHDFSALRGSGCGAKSPVRTILGITLERLDALDFLGTKLSGDFFRISVEADGFLRHMVRNIVGTAVEVGRGRNAPEDIARILGSKDRRLAGPTAPARGLFLEKVTY